MRSSRGDGSCSWLLGQQWAGARRHSPGPGPPNLPTAVPEGNPSLPDWRCGGLPADCSPGEESADVGNTRRRLREHSFTSASRTVIPDGRCRTSPCFDSLDVRDGARAGGNADSFVRSRIAGSIRSATGNQAADLVDRPDERSASTRRDAITLPAFVTAALLREQFDAQSGACPTVNCLEVLLTLPDERRSETGIRSCCCVLPHGTMNRTA